MLPDAVLLDPSVLENLPEYQKKATMSDAVCHAVESAWSSATCEESRAFSYSALDKIFANYKSYLAGDEQTFTKTTGGHALCYKLTTLYGISHGHAALLCVRALWNYMEGRTDNLEFVSRYKEQFDEYFRYLDLAKPDIPEEDYGILADSVNTERLSNNPAALTREDIVTVYRNL